MTTPSKRKGSKAELKKRKVQIPKDSRLGDSLEKSLVTNQISRFAEEEAI